MDKMST
jgi:hypothetical protein